MEEPRKRLAADWGETALPCGKEGAGMHRERDGRRIRLIGESIEHSGTGEKRNGASARDRPDACGSGVRRVAEARREEVGGPERNGGQRGAGGLKADAARERGLRRREESKNGPSAHRGFQLAKPDVPAARQKRARAACSQAERAALVRRFRTGEACHEGLTSPSRCAAPAWPSRPCPARRRRHSPVRAGAWCRRGCRGRPR